jgi:hypothetical protein
VTTALSIALALLFLAAAAGKLTGQTQEMATHLGIDAPRWRVIGVLELAGVAGVLAGLEWEWLGVAAAGGLVLTSIGAIATHVKAGDPLKAAVPASIGLALSCAVVVLQAT